MSARFALIRYSSGDNRRRTTIAFTRDRAEAKAFAEQESRKLAPQEAGLERVLWLHWIYEVRLLPKGWRPRKMRAPFGSTATQDDLQAEVLRKTCRLISPCDLDDETGR